MTGEKLKEFMRRLNAEGYKFELDDNGAGTIYRHGREAAIITDEDEIRYKPGNRQLAYHISDMRDEVNEYMTAYQNAAPGENGHRTLLMYAGTELAAKQQTRRY